MIFGSCDTCNYQSENMRCVIVSGQCWQCCSLRQSENPIRTAYRMCERCCYECLYACERCAPLRQRVSRGCINTFRKSAGNQIWLSGGSALAWLGSVARVERPNEKACGPLGRPSTSPKRKKSEWEQPPAKAKSADEHLPARSEKVAMNINDKQRIR